FIKYNKKKHVIALGMIYAGYIFVNQVFKRIIDRERPPVERIVEVTGSSFPSGHTMGAFAIYGALLVFVLASKKMQPVQKWLIPLLASLPFAVALSRNYLGAHYMTDVLGAAFLSITVICYTLALPIFKKKKSQSPE
ncbi:MAG TPA: phosphatase PAP2 family protein, partial [Savagea sp.]